MSDSKNEDYLTKLARATRRERELHERMLSLRREHAAAKRNKDALLNWLASAFADEPADA